MNKTIKTHESRRIEDAGERARALHVREQEHAAEALRWRERERQLESDWQSYLDRADEYAARIEAGATEVKRIEWLLEFQGRQLAAELHGKKRRAARLREECIRLSEDLTGLRQRARKLDSDRRAGLDREQQANAQLHRHTERVRGLEKELHESLQKVEELGTQLNGSRAEVARLAGQLNSLSWHLTAPARFLAGQLHNLFQYIDYGFNPYPESLPEPGMPIDKLKFQISTHNTYRLVDFLVFDEEAFIEAAYFGLLKRPPDSNGFEHYLAKLRADSSKVKILGTIRNSVEGRMVDARVKGLVFACALEDMYLWPVIGSLMRAFVRPFAYPPSAMYCKLSDLVVRYDEDFIRAVYLGILRRLPDATGLETYLHLLRRGAEKVDIVGRIRYSSEGRNMGVIVDGLIFPWTVYQILSMPIVGPLLNWLVTLIRLPGIVRRQRAIENYVMRYTASEHSAFGSRAFAARDPLAGDYDDLSHRAIGVMADLSRATRRG